MKHRLCILAVAIGAQLTSAQAQEIIKGVYLGSPELCAQAKKDSLQTVLEAGNVVLSNRGIDAIEFNCAFLQILKNPRMPAGWVATSMCEEPGYAYPDMFSVVERQAGQLEVAAMTEMNGELASPLPDEAPADAADAASPTTPPSPPQTAAPAPPAAADTPSPESENAGDGETEAAGLSGTYYLCDGLRLP